jgi:hypothetical protein
MKFTDFPKKVNRIILKMSLGLNFFKKDQSIFIHKYFVFYVKKVS